MIAPDTQASRQLTVHRAKRNFMGHRHWAHNVTAVALLLWALHAAADTPPGSDTLDTITVEAARQREMVAQQASRFLSGITVVRRDQSLANWQREIPICPLVAGLPREEGEYMLRRFSEIAASAGAPLAPEHCKPNLFVVVSSNPDELLKAWTKRDVRMFDTGDDHGFTPVRKFMDAKIPVRAWYNVEIYNSDGTPLNYSDLPGSSMTGVRVNEHSTATRIRFNDVRDLSSVIVLVDAPRARGVSFGQLAAYIAMVGLAEIKIDANASDTPSILQLFSKPETPTPPGLSAWDVAFLNGLYHTEHLDQRQISAVKTAMVRELAPPSRSPAK
jgi:hypothetical protein